MSEKNDYKNMSIKNLVILAQQDDLDALEELLRSQQKEIFATYMYLYDKRQDVADLTQEALLRIAKNIKNLKNPEKFKSWVNQITTHLFYDELRKISKKPEIISIDDEQDSPVSLKNVLPDTKCIPPEKCLTNELEEIIRTEINNLPQQFKIAIVMRELQGLSYEEIAYYTQASIGTVKSRISRARNKLQETLKNYI